MEKTVSNSYTLSYIVRHPKTKEIVLKHLLPLPGIREEQLIHVNGTLREMFETNMGGGIPYDIITALMNDLDELNYPLDNTGK